MDGKATSLVTDAEGKVTLTLEAGEHVISATHGTLTLVPPVCTATVNATETQATTEAPTTEASTTEAPTTQSPATQDPATEESSTDTSASEGGCKAVTHGAIGLATLFGLATFAMVKRKEK